MSSPPPGGPQTPQPPYPQSPPPQYPPQYPPQQPYYAQPVTPPPKKSNTALIVVLIVVVVVVVLAVLAWYAITVMLAPAQNLTRVTITSASWTISGDSTDFASSSLACGNRCPMTVFVGTQFTYTFTLHNTDALSAHNVTSISVGTPFTLVSSTPVLPATIPASSSTTFQLSIAASTIGGSYTLAGVIYTS
jgi:hypothetical protein